MTKPIDPRLPNLHAAMGSGDWGAPATAFPCDHGCGRVFEHYIAALMHTCPPAPAPAPTFTPTHLENP